jgi:hypothetical protein
MQELTFEQVEVVSGGFQGLTAPAGMHSSTLYQLTTDGEPNNGGGFWSEVGGALKGVAGGVKALGEGIRDGITDLTGTFNNWIDSKNIENMCASGHVDSVKTDNMEVKCK